MKLWHDVGHAVEDLMADQLYRDEWLIYQDERLLRQHAHPMWWGPRWWMARR